MKKLIISIIGTIIIIITTIVSTFAWFISYSQVDPDVTGYSAAAYFASGDGLTEETAYEITSPRHLYNLAWLQYLGKFNTATDGVLNKQYYFKITKDIDMTGYAIPPIGTEKNPFVGFLNGNNKVISNVNIYNNLNNIPVHPTVVDKIEDCNIMGLFGIIGNYNSMYANYAKTNLVQQIYTNNLSVTSSLTSTKIGLFAGYVAGGAEISTIGVHYSSLHLASGSTPYTGNSLSRYALIGDYDDKSISWVDKPSDGTGFGSSFDIAKLFNRLTYIKQNKYSSTPSSHLPNMDSSSDLALASNEFIPLTIRNKVDENAYTGSEAVEIPSKENIGYFLGNQNKLSKKQITFTTLNSSTDSSGKITYSWRGGTPQVFFKRTGQNATTTSENIKALTSDEVSTLPTGMQELIKESSNHAVLRLQCKFEPVEGSDSDKNKYTNGKTISYYNNTYENVYLPNNGIWFKPKIAGKYQFVIYTANDGENFSFGRLTRNITQAPNESENDFLTKYFKTPFNSYSEISIYSYNLPKFALILFEYEISSEDISKNYEFLLSNDRGGSGAYFLYLDIGTNGGSSSETSSTIKGIDFVYATTSTDNGFSSIAEEFSSAVYFTITGESTKQLGFYFRRRNTESDTKVLYYATDSLIITPNDTNLVLIATDNTCTTATS